MHSLEVEYLVRQEYYKDRLRELERERLLQAAGLQQGVDFKSYRKAANWLGKQMVKWGSKLQEYDTTSPSETYALKT